MKLYVFLEAVNDILNVLRWLVDFINLLAS
jgi:hypothetical protein